MTETNLGTNNVQQNQRSQPSQPGQAGRSNSRRPKLPGRSDIRAGLPKRKVITLKLNFTNIMLILFIVFAGYFFISSLLAPDKGKEVSVDEFVSNIKDNRYAQVNIEYNGDAVGYNKYLVEVDKYSPENLSENKGTNVVESSEFQKVTLDEFFDKFQDKGYTQKFQDFFLGGTNGIKEFVVLDTTVIARTTSSQQKDYLIENTHEQQFKEALNTNGFDNSELKVVWTYLRTAGDNINQEDFNERFKDGRYEEVWLVGEDTYAKEKQTKIERSHVNWKSFTTDFSKFMQEEGIDFDSKNVEILSVYNPPVSFDTILWIVAMGAMFFAVTMLVKAMQGQGNGLMQFGQSKARLFWGKKPEITFKDVAGIDEAKEELNEIVLFLKSPKKFTNLGARIPKGVLMVGAPGTGKTLLAKAIAGEAGVPFFHTSGSEFEEMLVGAGASRVRDLFVKAKRAAPSLIFIDEIDAIARKRGTTVQSSHTEQTLNQILVEMDGFEPNQNVIVIAATNRPDVLDPAILRPGRFDRRVVLDLPDIEGRVEILKIHSKNKPLSKEVDLEKIAKRTVGFSGADLENMLNEAAIIAAKDNRKEVTPSDLEESATKVVAGPEKRRKRTSEELEMTAYHEAGHAIVAKFSPKSDPVHRVTIISRGMALGWTMQLPDRDKYQQTQQELMSRIQVMMGGRAAEELVFGDITSGASNDIEQATSLARKMVKQFGMSKKLGLVKYGESNELQYLGYGYGEQRDYSDTTADEIDEEVKRLINDSYEEAKKILNGNMPKLKELVKMLLDKEVVEGEEFERLFGKN